MAEPAFFDSHYIVQAYRDDEGTICPQYSRHERRFDSIDEPICVYCGRTGAGVLTQPFMYAIPAELWRTCTREQGKLMYDDAGELIFPSDLKTEEGKAFARTLATPLYRCADRVIASLVKVEFDEHKGQVFKARVEHSQPWTCSCNGGGTTCDDDTADPSEITAKDEFLVYPVDAFDSELHWRCATVQCDACGCMCDAQGSDGTPSHMYMSKWTPLYGVYNEAGVHVELCGECEATGGLCHGARDMMEDGKEPGECSSSKEDEDLIFVRDYVLGAGRSISLYCQAHLPEEYKK